MCVCGCNIWEQHHSKWPGLGYIVFHLFISLGPVRKRPQAKTKTQQMCLCKWNIKFEVVWSFRNAAHMEIQQSMSIRWIVNFICVRAHFQVTAPVRWCAYAYVWFSIHAYCWCILIFTLVHCVFFLSWLPTITICIAYPKKFGYISQLWPYIYDTYRATPVHLAKPPHWFIYLEFWIERRTKHMHAWVFAHYRPCATVQRNNGAEAIVRSTLMKMA